MSDDERELRSMLEEMLGQADFPVSSKLELIPALPDGASTRFPVGDKDVSAMQLSGILSGHESFPYESPTDLIDDVVAGLKDEGYL